MGWIPLEILDPSLGSFPRNLETGGSHVTAQVDEHKTGLADHRLSWSGLTSGCLRAARSCGPSSELPALLRPPRPLLAAEVGRAPPRGEASALRPSKSTFVLSGCSNKAIKTDAACGFIF